MRILLILASIFFVNSVVADHRFNVRVTNVSGQSVEVRAISIDPKGPGLNSLCAHSQDAFPIVSNGNYTNCTADARKKNWQRRIIVQFHCTDSNIAATMTYPRNGGWFGRNYLNNNSNRYTVAIKKNDC